MFFTHPKTNFIFSVAFISSSTIALNLDQSKFYSFGKELSGFPCLGRSRQDCTVKYLTECNGKRSKDQLNSLPTGKILAFTKLKAFATDKLGVAQNIFL